LEKTSQKYRVKIYTGDYIDRQEAANEDGAICYVEHHLNSKAYDDPQTGDDNPILTIVAHNASLKSIEFAAAYSSNAQEAFPELPLYRGREPGVLQRGYRERGDYNLRFTKMPAILLEPMWVSDKESCQALAVRSTREALAEVLADTITSQFPEGGLVALSGGHKGKVSKPWDRGAPMAYPEFLDRERILGLDSLPIPEGPTEADVCELIVRRAAELLTLAK
jgi:hypothetical protein